MSTTQPLISFAEDRSTSNTFLQTGSKGSKPVKQRPDVSTEQAFSARAPREQKPQMAGLQKLESIMEGSLTKFQPTVESEWESHHGSPLPITANSRDVFPPSSDDNNSDHGSVSGSGNKNDGTGTIVLSREEEPADDSDTSQEVENGRRQEVLEKIRAVIKNRGTHYEVLDVEKNASKTDIIQDYRELSRVVRSDKNMDTASQRCGQAINVAKEVLCDDNARTRYDKAITIGPPPAEIRAHQKSIGGYVSKIFKQLETPIDQAYKRKIGDYNHQIRVLNKETNKLPLDTYQVPLAELTKIHYACMDAAKNITTETTPETIKPVINGLQKFVQIYFRKAQKYQWPAGIYESFKDSLIGRIAGDKSKAQQIKEQPIDNKPQQHNDMVMDDAPQPNGSAEVRLRQIQPLKAGFTILGEEILGYIPIMRWNKFLKKDIPEGFKILIRQPGTNPIKYATGSQVGSQAILEYDQSGKINDLREYRGLFKKHDVTNFQEIIGIAWNPWTGSTVRVQDMYIWVQLREELVPGKAHILMRSNFQGWLGTELANALIDDFFVKRDLTPPWIDREGTSHFQDNYLPLVYPLPSGRQARKARLNIGYNSALALPAPSTLTGQRSGEPPLTDRIEALLERFETRLNLFEDQMKEQDERVTLLIGA